MRFARGLALGAILMGLGGGAKAATFQIEVNFSGDAQYQTMFEDAANFWETRILGRWDGFDPGALQIDASVGSVDGIGGTLAGAGPSYAACSDGSSDLGGCRSRNEYVFSTAGQMVFDVADIANVQSNGILDDIIRHEMAHVIGFGTLWEINGAYTAPNRDPNNDGINEVVSDGEYTGAFGLAAYQTEFAPGASFVPVEGHGGSGTADAHWDEFWPGGSNDLMTGFIGAQGTVLSTTTLQSFRDIGYLIAIPVPLPAAGAMLLSTLGLVWFFRRRTNTTAPKAKLIGS